MEQAKVEHDCANNPGIKKLEAFLEWTSVGDVTSNEKAMSMEYKRGKEEQIHWNDAYLNVKTKKCTVNVERRAASMQLNSSKRQSSKGINIGKSMIIGTWNVRGTYASGNLTELIGEVKRYKLDIIALQETKQRGTDVIEMEDVMFFKSGGDDRKLGSGFIVQKAFVQRVLSFKAISERMCVIRLKGEKGNVSILNVHAHTEEKEDDLKDTFYEVLEEEYEQLHKHDIKIVIGDCNAKIGKEDIYVGTTGRHSKHDISNDNGKRLIAFAVERSMVIRSTQLQRKEIHKGTWMSPDRKTINQIDHVLIDRRHMNLIENIRSMRGAECNSDHLLVRVTCGANGRKEMVKAVERKVTRKFDINLLQKEEWMKRYKLVVTEMLNNLQESADTEELWGQVKETIIRASNLSILRRPQSIRHKQWFDEECKVMVADIRNLRQAVLMDLDGSNVQRYKEKRREIKRVCRRKKREFMEDKIKSIEEKFQRKEIRSFYQEMKGYAKGWKNKSTFVINKEGEMEFDPEKIMDTWKQYFRGLLNCEVDIDNGCSEVLEEDSEATEKPTKEEIADIIKSLRNNKACGESEIAAEMIKYGGEQLEDLLYKLIARIWQTEQMPHDWFNALIYPLYKKGNRLCCENYRGIAILEVPYKVLAQILSRKLKVYAETVLGEYQAGFRSGRTVIDQVFVLKEVQTSCYEYKMVLHTLFIDFKQAYDSISRVKMYDALGHLGVPYKLIRLIKMTLYATKCKVWWNGNKSEDFTVVNGLRQGDPLSTTLFNLVLESIIRQAKIHTDGIIINNEHQCIAYADDITLISKTKKGLVKITERLENEAARFGLTINQEKTKYMVMGNTEQKGEQNLSIKGFNGRSYTFEKVSSFTYLGVRINENGLEEQEIEARIARANQKYGMLRPLVKSPDVSRKTKIRIYKTVVRPTATYACETWVLKKSEEDRMERWERKMLRSIYGGIKTEEGWRRRTNKELKQLYDEPSITTFIRVQRLRWLGQVQRLEEQRVTKIAMTRRPIGSKKRGRPRRRWQDSVLQDLKEINVVDWRSAAMDKRGWKGTIRRFKEFKEFI